MLLDGPTQATKQPSRSHKHLRMDLDSWNHSGWIERPSSTANGPFPNQRHTIFSSDTEQTLGLPLHLLDHSLLQAIEQSNHTVKTPNDHHEFVRSDSVPVEQLREEVLWPQQRVEIPEQDQQQHPLICQEIWQSTSTDNLPSAEVQHDPVTEERGITQPSVAPVSVKRKRGRPRLYATPPYEQSSDLYGDVALDSRKSQLEKNRIAAGKSRRRRKEHTNEMTAKVSVLSSRNEALKAEESALREELLNFKNEILRHAGCSSPIIDGYIARVAGGKLAKVAHKHVLSRKDSGHSTSPESHDRREESPSMAAWKRGQIQAGLAGPNQYTTTSSRDLLEMMNDFLDTEG